MSLFISLMCGFPSKLYDVNNPDWIPSVYESHSMQSRAERYEELQKGRESVWRKMMKREGNTPPSEGSLLVMDTGVAVQTDLSLDTVLDLATPQDVKQLRSQLEQYKKENDALKGVKELKQEVKELSLNEAYYTDLLIILTDL